MKKMLKIIIIPIVIIAVVFSFLLLQVSFCDRFVMAEIVPGSICETDESVIDDPNIAELHNTNNKKVMCCSVKMSNYSFFKLSDLFISFNDNEHIETVTSMNIIEGSINVNPFSSNEEKVFFIVDETMSVEKFAEEIDDMDFSLQYNLCGVNKGPYETRIEEC